MHQHTEEVQRIALIRLGPKDTLVGVLGGGQFPALMEGHGRFEGWEDFLGRHCSTLELDCRRHCAGLGIIGL